MEKQVGKMFVWVIKNFSFLNSEKCCSDPFVICGFKWHLLAECDLLFLSLRLCIADSQSLPSEALKVRLSILNQQSKKLSVVKDSEHCFDEQSPTLDYTFPYELLAEDDGFLLNGELMIVAEVIGASDVFEESFPLRKLEDNGFHVLPSQVESVRRIFERHPDTAIEFRAKNQHLRTTFMNFLLSLIETLYQPLQELSNEDLVEADIALTYLKDVGFKVDWLEKKLDQLKEKKEKELFCAARVQEMEAQLHDLKRKYEMEKVELLVARAPLSFDDGPVRFVVASDSDRRLRSNVVRLVVAASSGQSLRLKTAISDHKLQSLRFPATHLKTRRLFSLNKEKDKNTL